MTDQYLTSILEEVERIAKQHNQVAQFTDHPEHEYLRYAVLRLLEGEADETSVVVPQIGGMTVGYGEDEAMFDSWAPAKTGGRQFRRRKRVPTPGCSSRMTTREYHGSSSM